MSKITIGERQLSPVSLLGSPVLCSHRFLEHWRQSTDIEIPAGYHKLAAVTSSAVWKMLLTRLSMPSPVQGLGPLEGFWITHSLPGFPLPPASSGSQSQGKRPG